MAEIITGDKTKSIKGVGELSLRISAFDSYRLFTLYENVNKDSQKVMDVSGNQKYYLVFKSPNKEIRIPEYDPKGFLRLIKLMVVFFLRSQKRIHPLTLSTSKNPLGSYSGILISFLGDLKTK